MKQRQNSTYLSQYYENGTDAHDTMSGYESNPISIT